MWRTGYPWQGRLASFAMDEDHLRTCARDGRYFAIMRINSN